MAEQKRVIPLSVCAMILGGVTMIVAPVLGGFWSAFGIARSMPTDGSTEEIHEFLGASAAIQWTGYVSMGLAAVGLVAFVIGTISLIWGWTEDRPKVAPDR